MALASGLTCAVAVPFMLASCAAPDAGTEPEGEPATVPDAGAADGGDAGCDVSNPACVTKPISCEDAAWCPVPTNVANLYALTAVWGSSKDDVWAAGSGGTVLHWDGLAWKPTPLPTETALPVKNTFHALWGSGPNDVWVASATNLIFHTDGFKNGTATWVRAPAAVPSAFAPAPIYAVWGTGPDDLRFGGRAYRMRDTNGDVVVRNQVVKKTSAAGIEWTGESGTATIHGLWGSSPDDLWLIGDNRGTKGWQVGLTMHGTRHGEDLVWTEVDSRAAIVLRGIWGSSATDIWMVGDKGTIRHFGPNATEWAVVESPTTETLQAVWGAAPNDVWAVGESGAIIHWDGAAWKPSLAAFPVNKKKPHLYGVWGSGPDDVWIVGDGIALRFTGNTGGAK
jgi:hypothetical protein